MKLKITNTLLIVATSVILMSCGHVNVQVDKTQAISETETHMVVPSTAVTPVLDAAPINAFVAENIQNLIPVAQK